MKEVTQVTIYLPVKKHIMLKIVAAQQGTPVSTIIEELVDIYIAKENHG